MSFKEVLVVSFVAMLVGVAIARFGMSTERPSGSGVAEGSQVPHQPVAKAERKLPAARTYNLPMLAVYESSSGVKAASCSFNPLTITFTEDKSPLRISFSEDTPRGTGDMIRNSIWTAALTAALQRGSTLQGVQISLNLKGRVDGPSAGAVICLGIMSALDGRGFPADFAMTGAILPDGTIGLVGGVAEKLLAAANNPKIKRVAIPAFQRFVQEEDGKWVDLLETGRSSGLEVYLVESIADAYRALHHVHKINSYKVSAILDCREDPTLEGQAASAFVGRISNLRARIDGLSSNAYESVSTGWEWRDDINPEIAESRFSEGAILDALRLVSRANSGLDAFFESSRVYDEYSEGFFKREEAANNGSRCPLRDTPGAEWPLEKQVAFTDGLQKAVAAFCEREFDIVSDEASQDAEGNDGGDNTNTTSDDGAKAEKDVASDAETAKPWDGFHPGAARSDFEAQFESIWESEKTIARYQFFKLRTLDVDELKELYGENRQAFIDQNTIIKNNLYLSLVEHNKEFGIDDVSMPILNAGPKIDSAVELFIKAWTTVDKTIDSEVMEIYATSSSVDKDTVRNHFISANIGYANYEFSKQRAQECLNWLGDANVRGQSLRYPSWTMSCFLFNAAELFADASAQLFALDGKINNASFVAFAMDKARSSAMQSIAACHRAGIPCVWPIMLFQAAERTRMFGGRTNTAILSDYWKATMVSKALVMAFSDGIGPKQGFNGYPTAETSDEVSADGAQTGGAPSGDAPAVPATPKEEKQQTAKE